MRPSSSSKLSAAAPPYVRGISKLPRTRTQVHYLAVAVCALVAVAALQLLAWSSRKAPRTRKHAVSNDSRYQAANASLALRPGGATRRDVVVTLAGECERHTPSKEQEAAGVVPEAYTALRCGCRKLAGAGSRAEWIGCQMKHGRNMTAGEMTRLEHKTGIRAMGHTKAILAFGTRVPGEPGWEQTV